MALIRKAGLFLIVGAILSLALLLGGLRLAVSNIDYFKAEIGYLLERDVSEGIVFNRVSGEMSGFNPILRIENVSLNLPDRSQPVFIDRFEVEFDFWASLRERVPVPLKISGKLEKVELRLDPAGQWWLNEYAIGPGPAADNAALPGFSRFLARLPRYLKLDLRRLIIRDQKHDEVHQLDRVAARIIHRHGQFFSQVSATLPQTLGRGLLLKSIVGPQSSLVYVNTTNLQISPLARLFNVDTRALKSGVLDGEVWLDMSGYRIDGVSGNLVLKQGVFQVETDKPLLSIDYHGRFNVDTGDPGWRISNQVDRLAIDGRNVPGFRTQVYVPGGASGNRLSAAIDRLPLSSLPVVAGQWLPNPVSRQIAQGRLQGELRSLLFEMDFDRPQLFRFAARVIDLSSERLGRIPGVTNLNADLVMGNNKLAAKVHGEDVSLDFGDQFRAPLHGDTLDMSATLNRRASGNLLLALDDIQLRNQDVSAVGRLRLESDGDNEPFMYLRANFVDAIASSTGKYIPLQLMPEKTIDWLDQGIVGGFVPAGNLQYHGRLLDMRKLARQRAVEFFVDFSVEDGEIMFAPGWLPARNVHGKVLFHNLGVEFDIERASYERLDAVKATGSIGNFELASLDLAVSTEAPTGDAIRIWGNTPVGERFRDVLANLQDFDGSVGANVDLRLPLGSEVNERKVRVEIDFRDAGARAPDWGLDLAQINGRLRVGEDSVDASGLSARFFGDPVSIDIASDDSAVNIRVEISGRLESANLLRRLPRSLAGRVSGSSDWQLRLDIAGDKAMADTPILQVQAASNLLHTQVALPSPFSKPGPVKTRFTTDVDFHAQRIRFHSRLGERLLGRGSLLVEAGQAYRLDALDIAFARELRAEQSAGIHLYGRIDELSVDDWRQLLKAENQASADMLASVKLDIDRVRAFRRTIDSVAFQMRRQQDRYRGVIEAPVVSGSFEVPHQLSTQDPLRIRLEYLNIEELEQENDYSELRPSDLPAMHLTVASVRYHGMAFNDLSLHARSASDRYSVTEFNLRRDALLLAGQAQWRYDAANSEHLSSVNLTIRGPGLGEAIDELGFGNSMSAGTIDFSGAFSWPAPLPEFNLGHVIGDARLKIEDGVLNNVEPGSGRFVGLLSLSALPRRLSLDFSDLLIGGMGFDDIKGTYHIADGVLHTRDTRMDGPAAKIKISGKTGIIDRSYDQKIRVTPKIRQTLPLIGAVSAGSGVGWGLLLLQNLFKKVIDDAVEVEYHVTGSWDDPQIDLIKAVDEEQHELPRIEK